MARLGLFLLLTSVALIDCGSSSALDDSSDAVADSRGSDVRADTDVTDGGVDTDYEYGCCTCTERPRDSDCGTITRDTGRPCPTDRPAVGSACASIGVNCFYIGSCATDPDDWVCYADGWRIGELGDCHSDAGTMDASDSDTLDGSGDVTPD